MSIKFHFGHMRFIEKTDCKLCASKWQCEVNGIASYVQEMPSALTKCKAFFHFC